MYWWVVGLGAVAIFQLVLAGYGRSRADVPGGRAFSWLLVGAALWTGGTALEPVVPVDWLVALETVQWVGKAILPTVWFGFVLVYVGYEVPTRAAVLLLLEPLVVVAAVVTNQYHGLIWASYDIAFQSGFTVWDIAYGPVFWLHVVYTYSLVSGSLILVGGLALESPPFRSRALVLVSGAVVPAVVNIAFIVGVAPWSVDLAPAALLWSGVAFAWLLFADDLFDVLPVAPWMAHRFAFEELSDPLVVVDGTGRVVECNAAASTVFDASKPALVGRSFRTLVGDRFGTALPALSSYPETQARLVHGGHVRYFSVRVSPLVGNARHGRGYLAAFRDVTERELQQQRLAVLNRVLRHNVRNDMNVVAGFADLVASDTDDDAIAGYAWHISSRADHLARWSDRARQAEALLDNAATHGTTLDLDDLLATIAARVRGAHPDAAVTVPERTGLGLVAPPSVEDALAELVTNGAQHNGRERPHVAVAVERDDGDLLLVVTDDGGGPHPDDLPSLDDEREPLAHGVGFGLWFVSWTAWALGGELTARTTPDGTAVVFRLPAARVTTTADANPGVGRTASRTDGAADDRTGTGETPTDGTRLQGASLTDGGAERTDGRTDDRPERADDGPV